MIELKLRKHDSNKYWARGRNGIFDPRIIWVFKSSDGNIIIDVQSRRAGPASPITLCLPILEMVKIGQAIIKECDANPDEIKPGTLENLSKLVSWLRSYPFDSQALDVKWIRAQADNLQHIINNPADELDNAMLDDIINVLDTEDIDPEILDEHPELKQAMLKAAQDYDMSDYNDYLDDTLTQEAKRLKISLKKYTRK